jgi:hypothetical protein
VADAPRAGRPPRADAAYRQALERAVETRPRDLGLPFAVGTSARLSAYLAQTTRRQECPARRAGCGRAGCGCCWRSRIALVGGPSTPWGTGTGTTPPQSPPAKRNWRRRKKAEQKGGRSARALRNALPRRDPQGDDPVSVCVRSGSGAASRRGCPRRARPGASRCSAVAVSRPWGAGAWKSSCAGQDAACFLLYLQALERRPVATGVATGKARR